MIIEFAALAQQCSPSVQLPVASAIVKTESAFNPFAIGVNQSARLTKQPESYSDAVYTAKRLLAAGQNIDMGLGQINSSNLGKLGLTVEQVFDPCTNMAAMEKILNNCLFKAGDNDIYKAFSCYNTGNHSKGFRNGYVAKVANNLSLYMNGQYSSVSINNSKNTTNYINSAPKFMQNMDAQDLAAFANNADMPANFTMNYQPQNPEHIQQVQQRQPEAFFISEKNSASNLLGGNHKAAMIF